MQFKLIPLLERIFLIALIIGIVLNLYKMGLPVLINISLGGLGIVYFLNTFQHLEIERKEDKPLGFKELLGLVVVPKVLWISLTISIIGILLYFINPDNDVYKILLYIGELNIAISTAILFILKFSESKYFDSMLPILYRAFPIFVANFYILFMFK